MTAATAVSPRICAQADGPVYGDHGRGLQIALVDDLEKGADAAAPGSSR